MPSRRSFMMISLVAAAVGVVTLVPALFLRRGSRSASPSTPRSLQELDMITREEWGAAEPDLVTSDETPYDRLTNSNGWMVYDRPLEEVLHTIIVHHSALPLSDGPREIQQLHMQERRFGDVGYQFMIDEKGRLYEGRALNVRGAHTAGFNSGAVGIMLMGNFEEIEPTTVQFDKLVALTKYLTGQYPIQNLAGHRDYNPGVTLCPGNHLAILLPELAEQVQLRYGI